MKTLYTYAGALTLTLGFASGCVPPVDNNVSINWVCDETGTDPDAPCDVDITGTSDTVTEVTVWDSAVLNSLTINDYVRKTEIYGAVEDVNIGGSGTLEIINIDPDPIISEINASGTSETRLSSGRFESISMTENSAVCMANFYAVQSQVIGPLSLSDSAAFVMNSGFFPMEGEAPVEMTLTGTSTAVFWGLNFSLVEAGLGGCTWDVEPDGVAHSPSQTFTASGGTCQITGVSANSEPVDFVVTIEDSASLQLISAPTTVHNCFL